MIPATVGAFILDRVKSEIFSSPQEAREAAEAYETIQQQMIDEDEFIGTEFSDDDGNAIGQAVRMLEVAVYVVSTERSDPEQDLLTAMRDPNAEITFRTRRGRVVGIVCIPPAQPEHGGGDRPKGFRADDI